MQQQQAQSRRTLALILSSAGAAIAYANFYLPYFSAEAAAARARSATQPRSTSASGSSGSSGSVWSNVSKQRDYLQSGASSSRKGDA